MVLLAKYPRAMVHENPRAESTEDGLNVDGDLGYATQ